ncbi:MAG: hypothetical protein HYT41_01130 [Candidatus Sungbacteria bacterium]|nr:hypothetical protein [Candidatus Sungbacteria bacterium]
MVTVLAFPLLGLAQEPPRGLISTGAEQTNITSVEDLQNVVSKIVGWAQVFFYIIATLFIVFAAFRYLTSGGDEEKITAAKNMLIYSIVAIAIAAIAGGVVLLVRNFINA